MVADKQSAQRFLPPPGQPVLVDLDRAYDEDGPRPRWQWYQRAVVPLQQASAKQMAFWLVVELMKFDRDEAYIEEWHWIGETAFQIAEIKALVHEIWGDRESPI